MSEALMELLKQVERGEMDTLLDAMEKRRKTLEWKKLPNRIILLRHGQSEGNVDASIYQTKGDPLLELTPKGLQQAREAGERLAKIVAEDKKIFVAVSPFERAQQTLYGVYEGGFPRERVGVVHHDPRIREQEFGNLQNVGLNAAAKAEVIKVGRFFYRRPNAESSADVFDRVQAFWESLLSDGPTSLLLGRESEFDTALLVTHGLTIRLLLMVLYQWSVQTFETVFNLGNCQHITLKKNMDRLSYELCAEESFPAQMPWATRSVHVKFKSMCADAALTRKLQDLRAFRNSAQGEALAEELDEAILKLEEQELKQTCKPFTVVDYLSIKPPRSMRKEEACERMVEGYGVRGSREELLAKADATTVDPNDVAYIDWWGSKLSLAGKKLRVRLDRPSLVSDDLDVSPGGRIGLNE